MWFETHENEYAYLLPHTSNLARYKCVHHSKTQQPSVFGPCDFEKQVCWLRISGNSDATSQKSCISDFANLMHLTPQMLGSGYEVRSNSGKKQLFFPRRYLRAQKEFEANFFLGMQEKLCSFDFRGLLVFCSTLSGPKSRITETFETENQQNHTFFKIIRDDGSWEEFWHKRPRKSTNQKQTISL